MCASLTLPFARQRQSSRFQGPLSSSAGARQDGTTRNGRLPCRSQANKCALGFQIGPPSSSCKHATVRYLERPSITKTVCIVSLPFRSAAKYRHQICSLCHRTRIMRGNRMRQQESARLVTRVWSAGAPAVVLARAAVVVQPDSMLTHLVSVVLVLPARSAAGDHATQGQSGTQTQQQAMM